MTPDPTTRELLGRVAAAHGTPTYAYLTDGVARRVQTLRDVFGGRFGVSFAVKSNPNPGLLAFLDPLVDTFDCSSIAEVERCLSLGVDPARITFSGPAKRDAELERAVEVGVGELVIESPRELAAVDLLARAKGRPQPILVRVNPARAPRKFGVQMSGRPSQFGFDEEDVGPVLTAIGHGAFPGVDLLGIHIYSGTNSLDAEAIAENFSIFTEIFAQCAANAAFEPKTLVFGSGFGVPYVASASPLDIDAVAAAVNPAIDAMKANPRLAGARCMLELGRWLVGPEGYYLTSVIGTKSSRGTEIRLCDGGMNHHLAACGLMGMVIRRPYPMFKVTPGDEPLGTKMLVGPLCTTIDTLAERVELPPLELGDVIAVASSGAYGPTASPSGFISHPPAQEVLVHGEGESAVFVDVTVRP